jgi:hypothetical protein
MPASAGFEVRCEVAIHIDISSSEIMIQKDGSNDLTGSLAEEIGK